MKIKLNWDYVQGETDTRTMKLRCIAGRGKRLFAPEEMEASLCIQDNMIFCISSIDTGDLESSNALCAEIARRFNEFPEELKK